jgi:hypothetical protein
MATSKLAKNILTSNSENIKFPSYRHKMDPVLVKGIVHLNNDTVPGAEFYSEAMWILPGDKSKEGLVQYESHTHEWDELISFSGFNYNDIQDLGAEIEFTIDNKKYILTRSFTAFVPAGMQHGPLIIRNVKRPIMHFMAGPTKRYD